MFIQGFKYIHKKKIGDTWGSDKLLIGSIKDLSLLSLSQKFAMVTPAQSASAVIEPGDLYMFMLLKIPQLLCGFYPVTLIAGHMNVVSEFTVLLSRLCTCVFGQTQYLEHYCILVC